MRLDIKPDTLKALRNGPHHMLSLLAEETQRLKCSSTVKITKMLMDKTRDISTDQQLIRYQSRRLHIDQLVVPGMPLPLAPLPTADRCHREELTGEAEEHPEGSQGPAV